MSKFRAASRRSLCVAAAAICAPFAFAQGSFVFPHVLEKDGGIVAVPWDVSGGQFSLRSDTGYEPFSGLFSFYGNDEVFKWLCANVNGAVVPETWDVFSLQSGATRAWTVVDMLPIELRFPACDIDSKDPAGLRAVGRITFKAKEGATLARAADVARRQKMWLQSNFRLRLGDLPTARVNKIDSFAIKMSVADLDGDGAPDRIVRSDDIVFHVPTADAAAFREAFEASKSGKPTPYSLSLSFLDADGNPLLTFSSMYYVGGFGPSDPWQDPNDPDATHLVRLIEAIQDESKSFTSIIR